MTERKTRIPANSAGYVTGLLRFICLPPSLAMNFLRSPAVSSGRWAIFHTGTHAILTIKSLLATASTSRDATELRCAQAVMFPAIPGTTLEQTAALIGVSRASVPRLQARFRQSMQTGKFHLRNWGGRRRELMTLEEEKKFLEPWEQQAKDGGILVVSVIRAALAQYSGRPIKASVVYRLLERHGWRKVTPDTHHPKSDPAAQEEWKKNFRKYWRPY